MELTIVNGVASPIKCYPNEIAEAQTILDALAKLSITTNIELQEALTVDTNGVHNLASSIFDGVLQEVVVQLTPTEQLHVDAYQAKAKEFSELILVAMGKLASQNPAWVNGMVSYGVAADQVTATLSANNIAPKVALAVMSEDGFNDITIGKAISALKLFEYQVPECLSNIRYAHGKSVEFLENKYDFSVLAPVVPAERLSAEIPEQ